MKQTQKRTNENKKGSGYQKARRPRWYHDRKLKTENHVTGTGAAKSETGAQGKLMYIMRHTLSTLSGASGYKDVQITSELPFMMDNDRLVSATFIGPECRVTGKSGQDCAYITARSEMGDEFLFPVSRQGADCDGDIHCRKLYEFFNTEASLKLNVIKANEGRVVSLELPIEAFTSEREFILADLKGRSPEQSLQRKQGQLK